MTYTTADIPTQGLPDPAQRPDVYDGVVLKRALAWLFDILFVAILASLFLPFTAFLGVFFFPLMMLTIGFFYRWFTIGNRSATWGMRIMSIELREADGQRLSSGAAFLHTLGYTISIGVSPLQLISIALMLFTERKQGLTDLVMGTAMVNRLR